MSSTIRISSIAHVAPEDGGGITFDVQYRPDFLDAFDPPRPPVEVRMTVGAQPVVTLPAPDPDADEVTTISVESGYGGAGLPFTGVLRIASIFEGESKPASVARIGLVLNPDDLHGFGATGSHRADLMVGGAGDDSLSGGRRDDTIVGGAGGDTLRGEEANDLLLGEAGGDRLEGGDGHDAMFAGAGEDTLLGGRGDDTAVGGFGSDSLNGGAGDDRLVGGTEARFVELDPDAAPDNDTLNGGGGQDSLFGGFGNDLLLGDDGDDDIYGEEGADTILGGPGEDYMHGGDGDDRITGNEGSDWIVGGFGADTIILGDKDDATDHVAYETKWDGGDLVRNFVRGQDKIVIGFAEDPLEVLAGPSNTAYAGTDPVLFYETATRSLWFLSEVDTLLLAHMPDVRTLSADDVLFA